jgi:hypothetical protein
MRNLLLIFLLVPAWIEIAQAMSFDEAVADIRQNCSRQIGDYANAIAGSYSTAQTMGIVTGHIQDAVNAPKSILEQAFNVQNGLGSTPVLVAFNSCLFKRRLSQLSNESTIARATPAAPVTSTNANPLRSQPIALPREYVPAPWPQRRPANPLEDDAVALSSALAYAQKRQSDVDRAREGKPKVHKNGAVAHHCLKPQTGGGVVNDCPFAVEYHYCVYHPTKDTWSAAFDCEKTRGGAWQIGPGPNSRSILHTAGETTYWFACRYGETISKPEGISPVDVEFQRGRGLVGRCGEWGSSRG